MWFRKKRDLPRVPDTTTLIPDSEDERSAPRERTPAASSKQTAVTGKKRTWPTVLVVLGLVMAVGVTGVAVTGGYLYNRFQGNIEEIPDVPVAGPAADNEPINILLMGTDKRTGKGNRGYGTDAGRGGERSDTTILLHLSADRSRALAVSIPRDTWVKMPECADGGGYFAKFNSAFDEGGPACTTQLVNQMSGAEINHIAVVDFGGFKELINALDGVEICLEQPVDDRDSQLQLPAGTHTVRDEQALAFVRARKTLGDGSDLGRIQRQQSFLSSAIRKATDTKLLLNPIKLFQVLESATKALRVDSGLKDIGAMRDLATSLQGIEPKDITFVTLPHDWRDEANVEEAKDRSKPLWQAIIDDSPWPAPVSRAADGKKVILAPSQVSINVINASGKKKATDKATSELAGLGFNIGEVNHQGGKASTTRVEYPSGRKDSARTLSAATGAPLELSSNVWSVTLVLGKDWNGKIASQMVVGQAKAVKNPVQQPTTADKKVCA